MTTRQWQVMDTNYTCKCLSALSHKWKKTVLNCVTGCVTIGYEGGLSSMQIFSYIRNMTWVLDIALTNSTLNPSLSQVHFITSHKNQIISSCHFLVTKNKQIIQLQPQNTILQEPTINNKPKFYRTWRFFTLFTTIYTFESTPLTTFI
jgi:hypothetical protein